MNYKTFLHSVGREDLLERLTEEIENRSLPRIINAEPESGACLNLGRVAVVGNGGILRKKPWGKLIDSFDRVVRFNHAISMVNNTADYSGVQTTDLVINCHQLNPTPSTYKQGYTALAPRWMQGLRDLNVIYVNSHPQDATNRGAIPDECTFFKLTGEQFHHPLHLGLISKPPTIGFAFVHYLIESGIKPHLFGFSSSDDDKHDHYFESRPPASGCHDNEQEKRLLAKYHKDGLCTVYR